MHFILKYERLKRFSCQGKSFGFSWKWNSYLFHSNKEYFWQKTDLNFAMPIEKYLRIPIRVPHYFHLSNKRGYLIRGEGADLNQKVKWVG